MVSWLHFQNDEIKVLNWQSFLDFEVCRIVEIKNLEVSVRSSYVRSAQDNANYISWQSYSVSWGNPADLLFVFLNLDNPLSHVANKGELVFCISNDGSDFSVAELISNL